LELHQEPVGWLVVVADQLEHVDRLNLPLALSGHSVQTLDLAH